MRKSQIVLICAACLVFVTSTVTAQKAKNAMTNADVIQMVSAGLSDQIITTSIRQAPAKDFDLTPTGLIALKKAGVSDAVILVMQEVSASAKSTSSEGNKMPADDREQTVNAVLRQAVISQSRGALTLSSFQKTNGYEQEVTKMYVLEWQAEILFEQEGYKMGNGFVGYWQDFRILQQRPGTLDSIGMSPIHFNKGARIRLTGDSTFRKTEQGWRLEGLKTGAAQVVAESGPTDPRPPVAGPTVAATSTRSFETMSAAIERGEEVVVNVKYNSAIPGYLYLANGKVIVSKSAVAFVFTYGIDDFTVSPEKILYVVSEPQQNARIHIKVAVKNRKGDKESTKDFYFYSPGAVAVGTGPGGSGGSISCNECDDSMSVLYKLLQKVRYPSSTAIKSEPGIDSTAAPTETSSAVLLTVDQILDKYLQAIGGKAAFEKLTTRVSKGSHVQIYGATNITSSLVVYAKAPNKAAWILELGNGKVQQIFDGTDGWIKYARGGANQVRGEELLRLKRESDFYGVAILNEGYAKMTLIRKDKVGDREIYVIEAVPHEGKPDTIYFDAQTGLVVRQDCVTEFIKGKPAPAEIYFEDYREVDGLKLPFMMRQTGPGYSVTVKFYEIKHNVPIDDAKFKKP